MMAFGDRAPDNPARHGRTVANIIKATTIYIIIALMTLWSALALSLDLPNSKAKIIAAVVYLLTSAAVLYFAKRRWQRFVGCLICFLLVLSWWLTLKPSNDAPWQTDVSHLASIDIDNGHAIIRNFRQCDYRAELEYTCTWSIVNVDLAQIQGVDLFMNYWGSPWIAHTIVSFDLGHDRHVAFSIETRKQVGQTYSALRGFFRQYTLISVVSDERDLVRLRTNYRRGEDLYLYHTRATPAFARALFLDYAALTNRLDLHPQWYNAITHNCTTEIFTFATMKSQPLDWRILLNGKADEMEYRRGELAGDLPFPELKRRAYINPAARAADKDQQFSAKIREGRPGFEN
jgi:Domain of unknown function (DUF4105)